MFILITTGIYPPKIGGPSQYAKNLKEVFEKRGVKVILKTYTLEDYLPTGIRHLVFFFKIIIPVILSDFIITLDTFSAGLPTVLAAKIFRKKVLLRTGGDFLWEQYTERTRKKVLLKNFYKEEILNLSLKEKIVFKFTKWVFKNVSALIFSTLWQRDIFLKPYEIDLKKTFIIENYYGPKQSDLPFDSYEFIGSSRPLVLKNLDILKKVFEEIKKDFLDVKLTLDSYPYEEFIKKISKCYAVILISLGDISPNLILEAIRFNRPFILTEETGLYDRLKDIGIFVNPLDEREIKEAVLKLLDEKNYKTAKEKILNFNFIHTWDDIAGEFLDIFKKI